LRKTGQKEKTGTFQEGGEKSARLRLGEEKEVRKKASRSLRGRGSPIAGDEGQTFNMIKKQHLHITEGQASASARTTSSKDGRVGKEPFSNAPFLGVGKKKKPPAGLGHKKEGRIRAKERKPMRGGKGFTRLCHLSFGAARGKNLLGEKKEKEKNPSNRKRKRAPPSRRYM